MHISEPNRTVFISGSNRGIGKACLELFAQRGWNVIAHARKPNSEFECLIKELGDKYSVSVMAIYFDMRDESAMKEAVKCSIYQPKLTVNTLVNNAGVLDTGLFLLTPMSKIREVFEVNLFAHMRLTQLITKRIPNGGSIVNIASVGGYTSFGRGVAAYVSSKAALLAWNQVLQLELLGRVRVNAVAPGLVDTDMAMKNEKLTCTIAARKEMNRLAKPEEVAKAVYFLSSEDAEFINGAVLKVTGGVDI